MKLDSLSFELDLVKARAAAVVGEERVWHGITYVKTITGWKPKGKEKTAKPEEVKQPRVKKIEDPSKIREKKLEEFASKAKDSQLEAAIKDPKQEQEVKDIAQAELDKRTGKEVEDEKSGGKKVEEVDQTSKNILDKFQKLKDELEATLKQKKEEKAQKKEEFKVIKKTGVSVDGHKVFITMNTDNTGYSAVGFGLHMDSEEGEMLSAFKERVKKEIQAKIENKKEVHEAVKKEIEKQTGTKLSEEFKPIDKTSVNVDGHQVFIERKGDQYEAKGQGVEMISEKGEGLNDFKEKTKEAIEESIKKKELIENFKKRLKKIMAWGEPGVEELKESPLLANFEDKKQFDNFLLGFFGSEKSKYEYFDQYRNAPIEYDPEKKRELLSGIDAVVDSVIEYENDTKQVKYSKQAVGGLLKNKISEHPTKDIMESVSGESVSDYYEGTGGKSLLLHQLMVQSSLIENNYEPICLPINYLNYKGEEYKCYDRAFYDAYEYDETYGDPDEQDEDGSDIVKEGKVWLAYSEGEDSSSITETERDYLGLYAGNSFYRFMTEYMINDGNLKKMNEEAKERGIEYMMGTEIALDNKISKKGALEMAVHATKVAIKNINKYIEKNPLKENTIFSRRVNPTLNQEIYTQMSMMKKGDEGSFKSIQSFSYVQKENFGDFQITLLAKKGDPIANAFNPWEQEYITKQNVKFRVLETGYNSMAIELIPEDKINKSMLEEDLLKAKAIWKC